MIELHCTIILGGSPLVQWPITQVTGSNLFTLNELGLQLTYQCEPPSIQYIPTQKAIEHGHL